MENSKQDGRPYLAGRTRPTFHTLRLSRTGNSLMVVIPRPLIEILGVGRGDEMRAYIVNGALVLDPTEANNFKPAVTSAEGDRA